MGRCSLCDDHHTPPVAEVAPTCHEGCPASPELGMCVHAPHTAVAERDTMTDLQNLKPKDYAEEVAIFYRHCAGSKHPGPLTPYGNLSPTVLTTTASEPT